MVEKISTKYLVKFRAPIMILKIFIDVNRTQECTFHEEI